jgi:cysteine desulfurase
MIYFDHNATTPLDERVMDAMLPYLSRFFGNPSSLYRLGRLARSAVETAREQVAALVGANPAEVVFTSGGTEANNLAIKGLGHSLPHGVAAVGATEHPSVTEPMAFVASQGWSVEKLVVDRDGLTSPDSSVGLSSASLRFASIMWANNETGAVNDIPAVAQALRDKGAVIHSDAVQAAGKIPVNFASSGLHLLTLSSHKIFGPKGAGALVRDRAVPLVPLLHGGGQEHDLRGGTENVAAIVGFGKAADLALRELEARRTRLMMLRQRLESGLAEFFGVTVFAREAERLPNTVQFSLPGFDGEMLVMLLDRHGVAVSSGSACASGAHEPSPVLRAMGVEPAVAEGAVRVSLGPSNSEAEIDRFLVILREVVGTDRRSAASTAAR